MLRSTLIVGATVLLRHIRKGRHKHTPRLASLDVEFGPLSREDFQTISRILEALIDSSDKAFALQRYKSSIKEASKVA